MKGHYKVTVSLVVILGIVSSIGILAVIMGGISSLNSTPRQAGSTTPRLKVGLINNFSVTKLDESLPLEPSFNVTAWTPDAFLGNLSGGTLNLDVLVLANVTFSAAFITGVKDYLDTKNGRVFFIMGNAGDSQGNLLLTLGLTTDSTIVNLEDTHALWKNVNDSHPLVKDIGWNSVPEVKAYCNTSWRFDKLDVLLKRFKELDPTAQTEPLLCEANEYYSRLIILPVWISTTDNQDIELSPYFNYFIYHTVQYLGGRTSASYADWDYSPVPHAAQQFWIYVYLAGIICVAVFGFLIARRQSKRPIEFKLLQKALKKGVLPKEETSKVVKLVGEVKEESRSGEVPPAKELENLQVEKQVLEGLKEDTSSEWEKVGMHRQISGFFTMLLLMGVVAVPSLLLTMYVYPRFIQPYPQVQGWSAWTGAFFAALYTIFDMGTGSALVKYFAEYRVKNPTKAIRYAQLYIWWQMLTGVIQITIVSTLGMFFFNHTDLGHMTWFFILASLGQFPGMLNAITLTLEGMQRFDVKIVTDVVAGQLVNTALNYAAILIFRWLYEASPMYGGAFGAAVGMSIGGIAGGWGSFMVTSIAFKRLGYNVRTLFRVDFGKAEIKEALTFGYKLALGNLVVPLVGMLEAWLLSVYVLNYNAELGYYNAMASVTSFIGKTGDMFSNIKPAISEAYGNKKMKLVEYYATESFRWMNLLTFVLFGVILAIGRPLLLGFSGQEWAPATNYLVVLCIYRLLEPYAWYGDVIFQGTGKTQYNAYVWIIEQGVRAGLLLLILPQMQLMIGVLIAYIPALAAKAIAIFIITRRKIVKFDWCLGHTVFAPVMSAIIIFLFANFLVGAIWSEDNLGSTILLLVSAIFGCLSLYMFFMGFFGGFDDNTLYEFKRGLKVLRAVKWFFFAFYKLAEFGHRISPFKNKFRVKVYEEARAEAIALTEEKKKLVI